MRWLVECTRSHVLRQVAVQHGTEDQPVSKGGGTKVPHHQSIALHLLGEPGAELLSFRHRTTNNTCMLVAMETSLGDPHMDQLTGTHAPFRLSLPMVTRLVVLLLDMTRGLLSSGMGCTR